MCRERGEQLIENLDRKKGKPGEEKMWQSGSHKREADMGEVEEEEEDEERKWERKSES